MKIKNIYYVLLLSFFCMSIKLKTNNIYTNTFQAAYINKEKPKESIKILEKVLLNSASITPYAQLIESYFSTKNFTKIVALVQNNQKILKLIMKNQKVGFIVVKSFLALNKNKEAMSLLIKLNNKYPDNQEIAFLTAQLYEQRKEIKNALKVSDNYLNKVTNKPSNFIFNYLNARLYIKLNDKDKALKSINKSLKQQQNFDLGWLIFAELKEKSNKIKDKKDAIKGYTRYLEIVQSPERTSASNIFIIKNVENKLLNLSFEQSIAKHPMQSKNKIEYCQLQAIKLFKEKKYKNALEALDECLSNQSSNNEEKKLFKVQILSKMQKYEEILKLVTTWIESEPNNELWYEVLYLLHHTPINSHKITKTLLQAEKQNKNNIYIKLHIAEHYIKLEKPKKAIISFKKALPLINNKTLKETVLYNMSLIYYDLNQYKKAQKILNSINIKTSNNLDISEHLTKINQKLTNKKEL